SLTGRAGPAPRPASPPPPAGVERPPIRRDRARKACPADPGTTREGSRDGRPLRSLPAGPVRRMQRWAPPGRGGRAPVPDPARDREARGGQLPRRARRSARPGHTLDRAAGDRVGEEARAVAGVAREAERGAPGARVPPGDAGRRDRCLASVRPRPPRGQASRLGEPLTVTDPVA